MLKECQAPFVKPTGNVQPKGQTQRDEDARSAALGAIGGTRKFYNTVDLAYPMRMNGTSVMAIATLDTGAQCSAIRIDVAEAAGVNWTPCLDYLGLRGVSGEPLDVHGIARLRIQAG